MTKFYEHWLGGETRAEAFRRARKEVRDIYPAPFVWAAFKLVGE
jgi:CHAT domain-containing protein